MEQHISNYNILYAPHEPNQGHLSKVIYQMRTLGPPTIHCLDKGNYLLALEGSHRIAAAFELGLTPQVVIVDPDDLVTVEMIGDYEYDDGAGMTALEWASRFEGLPYQF